MSTISTALQSVCEKDFDLHNLNLFKITRSEQFTINYPNGRNNNIFVNVLKGTLKFVVENKETVVLSEDDACFIPCGMVHNTVYCEQTNVMFGCSFDSDFENKQYCLSDKALVLGKNDMRYRQIYCDLLDSLLRAEAMTNGARPLYIKANLFSLLYTLSEEYSATIPQKYKRIVPMAKEIELNYKEQINISEMAARHYISESSFRMLFKEHYGLTPIEYKNRLRINKATELLKSGEFTVSEAAFAVGFDQVGYFCRLYKKLKGTTPGYGKHDN